MKILFVTVLILYSALLTSAHNLTDEEVLKWEAPEDLVKNFPYYLSGYDDEGAPIFVFEYGKWDLRTFIEKGDDVYNNMDIYGDQMFFRFREAGRASPAKQFCGIMDLADWPVRQASHFKTVQLTLQKFGRFEQIARNGDLKLAFIVNVNFLFEQVWAVGKSLLGALSERVELYGTNFDSWKHKLIKVFPKDQIPEWYGGSKFHKAIKVYG